MPAKIVFALKNLELWRRNKIISLASPIGAMGKLGLTNSKWVEQN